MPRARGCGDGDVVTPGGSSVIFVPENMVSILAAAGGLVEVESGCEQKYREVGVPIVLRNW
jgi:hypothetical protein